MTYLEQWRSLWKKLGVQECKETLWSELLSCYDETHRRYHTLQHLYECLDQFGQVRYLAECPEEVELAIWFHDAIYDVKRHDNEQQSADWAQRSILDANLPQELAQQVHRLVMATQHHSVAIGKDTKILVDIDLSILGSTPARFDEYESQIREEYAWVPELEFRLKRLQVLENFLMRSQIFNTEYFRSSYEELARENLQRSIQRLRTDSEAIDLDF